MSGTALVIGGGGSTGNAWALGVLAGLADGGLDVTDADVVVGTSAGSTTAVQALSGAVGELYAASLVPIPQGAGPDRTRAAAEGMARTADIIAASADIEDLRRRLGEAALAMDQDGSRSTRWREMVARRLPRQDWPDRELRITAVDARTGEPVVFTRESGVELADAVAASCSSGFAYAIGEERYLDGGYRRNENADLAAGCERVLVLSPFGGRSRHPIEWGSDLVTQVEELRSTGSRVEVIVPGEGAVHLFGASAMDLTLRPEAALLGHSQGFELAGGLSDFWR